MRFVFKKNSVIYPALIFHLLYPISSESGTSMPSDFDSAQKVDSAGANHIREFREVYTKSIPFSNAANESGLSIPDTEVKERLEALTRVYSGAKISPSQVKEMLLAEKFLAGKGIASNEVEPGGDAEEKSESLRFSSRSQKEAAEKAVLFQKLLERKNIQIEANNLMDIAQIKRNSDQKPPGIADPADLQVRGNPDNCLAWAETDCFVTVHEYNAAALLYPIAIRAPIDTIKFMILRNYLAEKHLADSARSLNLVGNPDSVISRQLSKTQGIRWLQSVKKFGIPVRDDASLHSAYGRYYSRYFAAREKYEVAVIGSTDSVYIDSLHKVFTSWETNRSLSEKGNRRHAKEPALPWEYLKDNDLPEEMFSFLDTLKFGHCSPLFRVSYGYFIARWTNVERKPEVSYSEAFPNLVYLATRDNFLNRDSVVEAQTRRYFRSNQEQFSFPDTLGLKVWMAPCNAVALKKENDAKGDRKAMSDTAAFKSLSISSLMLERECRIFLHRAIRKDSSKSFFGPFKGKFGIWYFEVQSKKMSHEVVPFWRVKSEIVQKLFEPNLENEWSLTSQEGKENVALTLGLAEAYRQSKIQKKIRMKERGIARQNGGNASISEYLHEQSGGSFESIEKKFKSEMEEKRKEIERAVHGARIDLNRLLN